MSLSTGLSPNVTKTALDKIFFSRYNYPMMAGQASAEDSMVFRQETTDRASVISEMYSGAGYFEERAELQDVTSATPRVGNQKTTAILNYAKSIDISKNFFDDDQHSVVQRMMEDMGRLARVSRDRNAFSVFNNGFTTETTNDGVALFSNSHVPLGGGTIDNLETGTLTEANLEAAINSMLEQKAQDGTLGGRMPATLLVPTALFKEASIILDSELRSGTANNDQNYYSSKYGMNVKFSPFLGAAYGGSDTAWFLLAEDHYITRVVRQGLTTDLVPYQYQRNNNYIFKAEYREVVDAVSYEGAVGSNGTV